MHEPITISLENDKTLSAIYSKPEDSEQSELKRKLVLMLHDIPGDMHAHSDLYGRIEDNLNGLGFHTLRFDFLCCGDSSGSLENFSFQQAKISLDGIKEWAEHSGYKEFVIISQGFGSMAAIMNMGKNLKCQVMLWPALNPQMLQDTLSGVEELPFIKNLHTLKFAPHFQDVTMPVLILQGSDDERYPISQLDLARKHMTARRIEITTFHDAGAGLPNENHREAMLFHISQFIEKYA